MGNFRDALTDYSVVVEKDPENNANRVIYSRLLFDAGNFREAAVGEIIY